MTSVDAAVRPCGVWSADAGSTGCNNEAGGDVSPPLVSLASATPVTAAPIAASTARPFGQREGVFGSMDVPGWCTVDLTAWGLPKLNATNSSAPPRAIQATAERSLGYAVVGTCSKSPTLKRSMCRHSSCSGRRRSGCSLLAWSLLALSCASCFSSMSTSTEMSLGVGRVRLTSTVSGANAVLSVSHRYTGSNKFSSEEQAEASEQVISRWTTSGVIKRCRC